VEVPGAVSSTVGDRLKLTAMRAARASASAAGCTVWMRRVGQRAMACGGSHAQLDAGRACGGLATKDE